MPSANRLPKLRRCLVEKELDAILISQPENRFYLSGFNGSAGDLLIMEKKAILATDFRYIEQAKAQAPGYEIFQTSGNLTKWFLELLNGLDIKKLGFEAEHVSYATHQQIADALNKQQKPPRLVPVIGMVESLRAVKEPEEIELIKKAAEIGDRACAHVEETIHAGMTEQQVAWEVEKFLRENGSQVLPFDVIVASGPNAALPHARPTPRPIQTGETVVIDLGARVAGYTSDLTRTICLSILDATFRKIYSIVLDAQLTAMAIIKDGTSGEQADNAAREVIRRAGYAEAFGHGLGHGVGLATHEAPRLGAGSADILAASMVFTIEPGIYLPGWGGVRIEDLVLLADGKVEIISKAGKLKL